MRERRYARRGRCSGRASSSTGNVRAQRGRVGVRYGCACGPDRFSCTSNDTAETGTRDRGARDGRSNREAAGRQLHFGPVTRVPQRDGIGDRLNGTEHLLLYHGHLQERPELRARPRPEDLKRRGRCKLVLEHRPINDARDLADRRDVRRRERTRDLRRSVEAR
jgi:hypothetical protein